MGRIHAARLVILLASLALAPALGGCTRFEPLYPPTPDVLFADGTIGDATSHAGPVDAGPVDASPVDAGPVDASPVDAIDATDAALWDVSGDSFDVSRDVAEDLSDAPEAPGDVPTDVADAMADGGGDVGDALAGDAADIGPDAGCIGGRPSDLGPCQYAVCSPSSGTWQIKQTAPGGACSDGDPCTMRTTCKADGVCGGGEPDAWTCPCQSDVNCARWGDGNPCNGVYTCDNQACVFHADRTVICPPTGSECSKNICNTSTGTCVLHTIREGRSCNDHDACSTRSYCSAGQCAAADSKTCPKLLCQTNVCDPSSGDCVATPRSNCCGNGQVEPGEQCDDGNSVSGDGCEPDCTFSPCAPRALALTDGCVMVPGASLMPATRDFTLEFAIKIEAANATSVPLFARTPDPLGPTPDRDWALTLEPPADGAADSTLRWSEDIGGGTHKTFDGPALSTGSWHRVALVRRSTYPGGSITWWVDGVRQAPVSILTYAANLSSAADLWIGCAAGSAPFFQGEIDEVRLSSVPRDESTVDLSKPFSASGSGNTTALYHFDNMAQGISPDDSLHGHSALWQGATQTASTLFSGNPAVGGVCKTTPCQRHALTFIASDKPDAHVRNPTALDGLQTFTIEFYLYLDAANDGQQIIGRDSGQVGAPDWDISVWSNASDPHLRWVEGQQGGNDNAIVSGGITLTVWHYVALVRRKSATKTTIQWFIDGHAERETTLSGVLDLSTHIDLFLGSFRGTAHFLTGAIDELRITAGALYQTDFDPSKEMPLTARSDTLALYHFDAGAGAFAYSELPAKLGPFVLHNVGWSTAVNSPSAIPACR